MSFHRFLLKNTFFKNFVGGPLHPAVGVYWATICFLNVIDSCGPIHISYGVKWAINGVLKKNPRFTTKYQVTYKMNATFKRLKSIKDNKQCYDCGAKNPNWAIVKYGVICILQIT